MRPLIIATSTKTPNMEQEISLGQRPRLDYVELSNRLQASYMDYEPQWLHQHNSVRRMEEKLRLDIYWAKQIAQKVKAEGYDVVFSMSERVGVPISHLLDRQVKHVVMLHHSMSPKKLLLIETLHTTSRWDIIMTFSRAEAEALQKRLHLGPERIRVVHLAIDTHFYKSGNGIGLQSDPDHILSLGLSNRDYPTLIHALHKLPHVSCQISATSAWVKHKAGYENENIPNNVQLKSYDHPTVIREAYAHSRFVVVPIIKNITQWSAGSVSVLQPQAMGKPIVTTRTPGLADYVLDGETGILVEPGNPAAMAEAIDYLWRNPDKAATMGRRAREWVEANFSLDKWLDEVSQLLVGQQ